MWFFKTGVKLPYFCSGSGVYRHVSGAGGQAVWSSDHKRRILPGRLRADDRKNSHNAWYPRQYLWPQREASGLQRAGLRGDGAGHRRLSQKRRYEWHALKAGADLKQAWLSGSGQTGDCIKWRWGDGLHILVRGGQKTIPAWFLRTQVRGWARRWKGKIPDRGDGQRADREERVCLRSWQDEGWKGQSPDPFWRRADTACQYQVYDVSCRI